MEKGLLGTDRASAAPRPGPPPRRWPEPPRRAGPPWPGGNEGPFTFRRAVRGRNLSVRKTLVPHPRAVRRLGRQGTAAPVTCMIPVRDGPMSAR